MIDQQTLDFIKQQIASGVSRDQITKDLLGDGWSESEIASALNVVGDIQNVLIDDSTYPDARSAKFHAHSENTGAPRKKLFLIILGTVLVIGGVVAGIFFAVSKSSKSDEDSAKEEQVVEEKIVEEAKEESTEPAKENTLVEEIPAEEEVPIDDQNPWAVYPNEKEKFSVSFMSRPFLTENIIKTEQGPMTLKIYDSVLEDIQTGLRHSVEYITPPATIFGKADTPAVREQKSLDFYKSLLTSTYGTVTYSAGTPLNGHKVVNYTIKAENKIFKGRIVSQNDKIYSYSGECIFCSEVPFLKEFIDSFKLLSL